MILKTENFSKITFAIVVAFLWLIHIPFSMAQTQQEASGLLKQLNERQEDTVRINLLQSLSRYYVGKIGEVPGDLDSADLFNKEAATLSKQSGFKPGAGRSLFLAGKIAWERKDQRKAMGLFNSALAYAKQYNLFKLEADIDVTLGQYTNIEGSNIDKKNSYFKDALLCYKKAGAKKEEGNVLESLGDIAQMKGDFGKSIELLQRSLDVFNAIGFKDVQGDYELLCDVYRQKGDFPLALRNGLLAVKTAEDFGDKNSTMTSIYNRVALIYYDLKNNDMALQYFQKSRNSAILAKDTASIFQLSVNMSGLLLRTGKAGDALNLLKSTQKNYPPKTSDFKMHLSDMLLRCYLKLGQYDQAKPYYEQMLVYFNQSPGSSDPGRLFSSRDVAEYLLAIGQYQKALPYIDSLQVLALKNHNVITQSQTELDYFKADSGIGKLKDAIVHYQQYKRLNDTLFNDDKARQFANLQLQFETEKKDKDIQLLRKEGLLQQATILKEKVTRNVIIGGIILLFLLLMLAYNRYRFKQRSNIALQKKQDEINYQNALLKKLLGEKEWLIKEIHHRVKNNLQIVISLLESQSAHLESDAAHVALLDSRNRVQAISLLHQKLYSSNNVTEVNMEAYVLDLVSYLDNTFNAKRNNIAFKNSIDPIRLDIGQALPVGMILNEAITNALKYAFPNGENSIISVSLKRVEGETIRLRISDNGIGLPAGNQNRATKSLGQTLIKGLSRQLKGRLVIEGSNGVVVTVEFEAETIQEIDRIVHLEQGY